MKHTWWLSFCSPTEGFLGACIVEADDLIDASRTAWKLGCNPGGEMMGETFTDQEKRRVKPEEIGRLMNKTECDAFSKGFLS